MNRRNPQPKKRRKRSQVAEVWHRLLKSKPAVISLCFIVLLVLCAVFAEYIAPYDYKEQDFLSTLQFPSLAHWMGTDDFGRDLLSRLLVGAQISLLVAFLSVAMSVVAALFIGSTVGYFGGLYDTIVMRILDIFMAIPSMMLSILVSVTLGTGVVNTSIAIAIGGVPALARTLRSATLPLRDQEYIEAARAFGASNMWIIWKHILPNTLAPLIVQISLRLGQSIIVIASLSFIGLGVQPPTPEWGNIMASGQEYIRSFWPLVTFPGILIGLSMLSFNLLGDGLRDAMDPRLK